MLRATAKLCCGIAHNHLPGLKATAVAAVQKDMKGLVARGSHHLPSKVPHSFQRLIGKEPAPGPEHSRDIGPSQFSSMDLFYITQGERALQWALSILQQHSSWQAETTPDSSVTVVSTAVPGLGKVFRAEVILPVPVEQLQQELFERMEQMPQWNPTLNQLKVLQRVGMDTVVTHEVTAPSPGNLVGQRDLVAGGARPPAWAESRLSCIVLQPLLGDPDRTHLIWLLSMDLKQDQLRVFSLPQGWIPMALVNRVLPQAQVDFIKHLQQHLCASTHP
ncbi:PREDICTED: steroidogenic acute regulatory protein, mitochondrial-like [Acanthisitta chloris]|uniref:steroidogenic acute regulatory protein, mitochondrial-like n=1 Tax=Acanthisitta chloris TaxID=57068 RepID=UPI0004F0F04A|nr:PREDICTED: steroidogenic acute regulatory protein, mitochondrial-like [Acanthisitta chloris]